MKILFVCTGNTCRSPMAEMIFKSVLQEKGVCGVKVSSAGVSCAGEIRMAAQAAETLKKNGCRLTVFKPKQLTTKILASNDLIICMTGAHKSALSGGANVYTLGEMTGRGDISDPYGGGEEAYRKCYCELREALNVLAEKLFNV